MMVIALSGMVVNPLAYLSELLSKSSEMDGYELRFAFAFDGIEPLYDA